MANEKTKKEVEVKNNVDSLSYTGKINVSLKKGKKVYFKKQFKNKGRWPLFFFITQCLRGDYTSADTFRPKYINVFGNPEWKGQPEPQITDDDSSLVMLDDYFKRDNNLSVISYPIMALPDVDLITEDNIGLSKITYKFNVPFSQLKERTNINAFALYAKQVKITSLDKTDLSCVNNPCAFFFIVDDQGRILDLMDGLAEQNIEQHIGDEYNLYIEWTLAISNASTIKPESSSSDEAEDASNSPDSLYDIAQDAANIAQDASNM